MRENQNKDKKVHIRFCPWVHLVTGINLEKESCSQDGFKSAANSNMFNAHQPDCKRRSSLIYKYKEKPLGEIQSTLQINPSLLCCLK